MNCKYMRTEYNYTPNDFDIYFNYDDIPSNIRLNDIVGLSNKLQQYMPLSKKVHLNLNTTNKKYASQINMHSTFKIGEKEVKFL